MEIKWTPWRRSYIKGETKSDACPFCEAAQGDDDAASLVLHRGEHCFVIMNLFPYNPGHLLIIPYLHAGDLEALPAATAAEIMHLTQRTLGVLRQALKPHSFNLGMNLGSSAGAGIPDHLHFHILPRWSGDTNFMPLIAGTKLIPEAMDDTYAALKPLFAHDP